MKDRFTIPGLRQKRARIAGEIEAGERKLVALRAALSNLDATLLLFDPHIDPAGIRVILAVERGKYFQQGEQTRLFLNAFRESQPPLTIRQLVEHSMQAKGLDVADTELRLRLTEQTRMTMKRLRRRGFVFKIAGRPATWWALPMVG